MEQKSDNILLGHTLALFRCNDSPLNRFCLNRLCINSVTVISDFNHNIVTILISIQEYGTDFRLSSLRTHFCRFQSMIRRITEQMHQRISDLIHNSSVQFCFFTGHIQFHLFIQLFGQLPDHSRELAHYALNGNHSYLHNGFMKIGGNTFKIFDLLIKAGSCHSFRTGSGYQRVFGDNQLTDKIHQYIQLFDIHTHSSVDYGFCSLLFILLCRSIRL